MYQEIQDHLRSRPQTWLITGVAGFIGSHLAERLLKLGQRVVGLDNFSSGNGDNLTQVKDTVGPRQWRNFRFWYVAKLAAVVRCILNQGRSPHPALAQRLPRVAALLIAGTLVSCGGGGGGGASTPPATGGNTAPPTVSITSPASGAIVSGSVNVTAAATAVSGVAGVQFQVDAANVGAEDTHAPYSATWDTTTASDGPHALTASARDIAGNVVTSVRVTVTVENTKQPPVAGRVEETDPAVSFSGAWTQLSPYYFAWSGGSAVQSIVPGSIASFTFTGTSVTWIGNRNGSSGIGIVKMDGVLVSEVNLFARTEEIHSPVFTVNGLSAGRHTLTIEVADHQYSEATGNAVVVDAFDVPARVVSHLQETDPDVAFTGSWAQADPGIAWSGGGVATLPDPPVGGARTSATPGAKAVLTFRGTAISWSGYRGPNGGIARVQVDGGVASEVDTYFPTDQIQDVVFTATGLTDVSHTLTVEATGRKNPLSTSAQVVVDAFDVTTPGRRYQEKDPAVVYSPGNWIWPNINRTWSEGAIAESPTAGATVTFTFTGTSVSWIGCRKLSTGSADIFLDDVLVKHVDTYLAPAPPGTLAVGTEAYQTTIFRADGLPVGTHKLKIVVTSTGSYTVIDAFDVRP